MTEKYQTPKGYHLVKDWDTLTPQEMFARGDLTGGGKWVFGHPACFDDNGKPYPYMVNLKGDEVQIDYNRCSVCNEERMSVVISDGGDAQAICVPCMVEAIKAIQGREKEARNERSEA